MAHYEYLKTLNYKEIEKGCLEWSSYRVPFNFREKLIKHNPPLNEDEFERELESPYKIKKFHYNYRHDFELSEENLQKTYVNMCTTAFFHNKDKTVRDDKLDFDSMHSEEKEEVMFKLKK